MLKSLSPYCDVCGEPIGLVGRGQRALGLMLLHDCEPAEPLRLPAPRPARRREPGIHVHAPYSEVVIVDIVPRETKWPDFVGGKAVLSIEEARRARDELSRALALIDDRRPGSEIGAMVRDAIHDRWSA